MEGILINTETKRFSEDVPRKAAHARTITGSIDALDQAIEQAMRTQELLMKLLEPITNHSLPTVGMKDPGETATDTPGAPSIDALFYRVDQLRMIDRRYAELLSSVMV